MDVVMQSPGRLTPSPCSINNSSPGPGSINRIKPLTKTNSPNSDTPTPTSQLKPKLSKLAISTPVSNESGGSSGSSGTTRRSNRHFVSTPVASAAKRIRRENSLRVNPFDQFLMDRLHQPVWSPSVLGSTLAETPPQKSWGIHQISLLNPIAIEDSPSTHQNEASLTPATEAKAQEAIQMFFSQPPDMTSPHVPHDEIDSGINNTTDITSNQCTYNNSTSPSHSQSQTQGSPGSTTKGVNTDLSLPTVLPPELEAMLYGYTFSSTASVTSSTDQLNSSLTRRKLEFSFDVSGTGSDLDASEILAYPVCDGAIIHSPGAGAPMEHGTPGNGSMSSFDPASCSSRVGLISPNSTPIRG